MDKLKLIQKMYEDGYFHRSYDENKLSDEHALRNMYKTINWLNNNQLPEWLKKDIQEYENKFNN